MSDDEETWYDADDTGPNDYETFFGGLPPGMNRGSKPKDKEPPPKPKEQGVNITPEQFHDLNLREELYRHTYFHIYEQTRRVESLRTGIRATPAQYALLRYKFNKRNKVVKELASPETVDISTVSILDLMIWIAHLFILKGFNMSEIALATLLSAKCYPVLFGASLTFLKNTFEDPRIRLNADFTKEEILAMELEFNEKFKTNGLFFIYDFTTIYGTKGGKGQRMLIICNAAYKIRWCEVVDAEISDPDDVVFKRTKFYKHLVKDILPMKLKLRCRLCNNKHLLDIFGFGDTKSDPEGKLHLLSDGLLYKPFFAKGVNMEYRVMSEEFVFNKFFEAIRWPIEGVIGVLKKCKYLQVHFYLDQYSKELHELALATICMRYNAKQSGFFNSSKIPPQDNSPWPSNSQMYQTINVQMNCLEHFQCSFDFVPIRRLVQMRYAPGNTTRIPVTTTTTVTVSKRPITTTPPSFPVTTAVKMATLKLMDELFPCSEDSDEDED